MVHWRARLTLLAALALIAFAALGGGFHWNSMFASE